MLDNNSQLHPLHATFKPLTKSQEEKFESEGNNNRGYISKSVDFETSEAMKIQQGCYAITTAHSEKPVLGTTGLGPCISIAIYNEQSKMAFLAHSDATNIIDFKELSKLFPPDSSVVHLSGSTPKSRVFAVSMLQKFKQYGYALGRTSLLHDNYQYYEDNVKNLCSGTLTLKEIEIWTNTYSPQAIAIDARTGTIYYLQFDMIGHLPESITKIERPDGVHHLIKQYDGRIVEISSCFSQEPSTVKNTAVNSKTELAPNSFKNTSVPIKSLSNHYSEKPKRDNSTLGLKSNISTNQHIASLKNNIPSNNENELILSSSVENANKRINNSLTTERKRSISISEMLDEDSEDENGSANYNHNHFDVECPVKSSDNNNHSSIKQSQHLTSNNYNDNNQNVLWKKQDHSIKLNHSDNKNMTFKNSSNKPQCIIL